MRKFKEVKRKEIIYSLSEWKQIERAAAKVSMQTSEYIRRMSLNGEVTYLNMEGGCICPHAAGRDKQFRIGEYTWKCSPSGRNGNPVIFWVRLAVIRQDQKGGHERADGGIIKHMERRMGKTGNNKKHYKGVP